MALRRGSPLHFADDAGLFGIIHRAGTGGPLQAHRSGILLERDRALVIGGRGEAALRVFCGLLQRGDGGDAGGLVEDRLPLLVEPALADGVHIPVRLVHRGVDRLQAIDGAGAGGAVQGLGERLVFRDGFRNLLAGALQHIAAIEHQHHVDIGRDHPDMALIGEGLDDGIGDVIELELGLVLGPEIIERAYPAGFHEIRESGVRGIDDIQRVGLGGERDGGEFQRLVERHQLGIDLNARHRGLHFRRPKLERGIAMADHLHRAGGAGGARQGGGEPRAGGGADGLAAADGVFHGGSPECCGLMARCYVRSVHEPRGVDYSAATCGTFSRA